MEGDLGRGLYWDLKGEVGVARPRDHPRALQLGAKFRCGLHQWLRSFPRTWLWRTGSRGGSFRWWLWHGVSWWSSTRSAALARDSTSWPLRRCLVHGRSRRASSFLQPWRLESQLGCSVWWLCRKISCLGLSVRPSGISRVSRRPAIHPVLCVPKPQVHEGGLLNTNCTN